jgi:hypothetical protein
MEEASDEAAHADSILRSVLTAKVGIKSRTLGVLRSAGGFDS